MASSALGYASTYDGGVWKRGPRLIVHRRAHLPPICIKTGQPVIEFVNLRLFWHPWWCFLGLFLGGLPYVVLALMFGRHARLEVGLCDAWKQRLRRQFIAGLVMLLSGILLLVLCIGLAYAEFYWMLLGVFPAVLLMVIGVCVLIFGGSPVAATKITSEYIHLKGVNRPVRERFPDWPWN